MVESLNLAGLIQVSIVFDLAQNSNTLLSFLLIAKESSLGTLNPEAIEVAAAERLLAQRDQLLYRVFVRDIRRFLRLRGRLSLFLFGALLGFLGLLTSLQGIFFHFRCCLLASSDLVLFGLLFSLDSLTLLADSWIIVLGELDEAEDAGALGLHVLGTMPFILLLHISALIPIRSLTHIVLVVLRELSP